MIPTSVKIVFVGHFEYWTYTVCQSDLLLFVGMSKQANGCHHN